MPLIGHKGAPYRALSMEGAPSKWLAGATRHADHAFRLAKAATTAKGWQAAADAHYQAAQSYRDARDYQRAEQHEAMARKCEDRAV